MTATPDQVASHPPHPRPASQPPRASGQREDGATAKASPASRNGRWVSDATVHWTCDAVGTGSLIASLKLMSVSSTMLHAVEVFDAAGVTHRLALRRFHNRKRLEHDPWYSPANEAAVLGLLGSTRVPAPRMLSADITPTVCDLPTLLTTRVPGEPPGSPRDLESFLRGLAYALSLIHAVPDPGPQVLPPYRPYFDPAIDGERRPPSWSPRAKMWERVFETIEGRPAPATGFGFIHRDYHPGQTLWADERLVGVVDWTTGCRGPYAIDLARMRLNLASRFGVDVAQRFADLHQEISGSDLVQPYWDLLDAADVLIERSPPESPSEEFEYARFEDWVSQAVSALG